MALLVVLCGTRRLGTSEYRGLFHCLKRIHVNTKVQFCFVCPEDLNHLQVFSLYAFLILLGDPFWNFLGFSSKHFPLSVCIRPKLFRNPIFWACFLLVSGSQLSLNYVDQFLCPDTRRTSKKLPIIFSLNRC